MFRLTLRDLQFRSKRFALVIAGTTIVFALLLLMGGLANHFYLEPVHAVDALGADVWVLPQGVSGPFTAASAIDPALASHVEGAEHADPILIARGSLIHAGKSREIVVVGHVVEGVGSPVVTKGEAARNPGEIVLDDSAKVGVGARVQVGATDFVVTGLTKDATVLAGIPFAFMSLDDAQQTLFQGRRLASAIVTRGKPSSIPDGMVAHSRAQVAADTREPLKNATKSVDLIKLLLWVVSAMIIGGVVYLSSMERRRDFAVLKAVGAETRSLLNGVAAQSLFVALAASGLAAGLQAALVPVFPLRVEVAAGSLVKLPALAVVVSLAASVAGMRRVAKTDPSAAFAAQGG